MSRPLDGVVVLFDLDGTLTDSAPGIVASMHYLAQKLGLQQMPDDARHRFVGPPMHDNLRYLMRLNGIAPTPERLAAAVEVFREYYVPIGMFDNALFEGVRPMITDLRDAGATLAIATSKAEPFAERIVAHFGLADDFDAVTGSTLEGTRTAKAQIVAEVLHRLGNPDPGRTLMIGDRSHDVHGAAEHGIACLGVGWGYGTASEVADAGAIAVLDSPADVLPAVLGWASVAVEASA